MATELQGPAIEAMIVLALICFGIGGIVGALLIRIGRSSEPAAPTVDLNLLIGLLHKLVGGSSQGGGPDVVAVQKSLDEALSRLGTLISAVKSNKPGG